MNQEIILPLVLQVCAVAVIVAEVVLPSGGVLSALSVGLFGFSLFLAFTRVGAGAGVGFLIADIIIVPIVLVYALRALGSSTATLQTRLSHTDGVTSQDPEAGAYKGAEGVAYTSLRPSGTALINETRVDVVTDGEFLEKGTPLHVVNVEGNRVVVAKKEENPDTQQT